MSLHDDPRYVALAKAAALVLGSKDPDIVAAILAQWTCEKGNSDPYPPVRNNPGNLAQHTAQGLGYPFHIDWPNPQPGNPIVTFDTPTHGAQAYGKLIATGSRYAAVRAAVAAGNGHAYIIAMGQSGYGTSIVCMVDAYVPPAPPTDTGGTEAILHLVPGITYKTNILCKPGQKVLNAPGGTQIYLTHTGDKFPEVGDYISNGGDYHVMRMPGDIAGYLAHGGTLGTVPI